ncbi:hypothetical protein C0971_01960 [Bacillus methanolicus]|nr:hypothetical protein C0971_01960 [Bacillus methanolicus]
MHMQKYYGIRHLEHLKNEGIVPIPYKDRNERPDLWGLNRKTMKSYLVEAKGSIGFKKYFDNADIRKAEQQLNTIKQIDYSTSSGISFIFNEAMHNLEKLIVATHPNEDEELTQHIIDPNNSEEVIVNINGDELVFKYYYNLIDWLINENKREIAVFLNQKKIEFVVFDLPDLSISVGVLKEIYVYLENLVKKEKYQILVLQYKSGVV